MESYAIGVDAGATKTLIWASTEDGSKSCSFTDAGINLYRVDQGTAYATLMRLIAQVRDAMGNARPMAFCAGIAGAGTATVPNPATPLLQQSLSEALDFPVQLVNDAIIAAEGALEGESGILVIVGTGSNVLGKCTDGVYVTTGAWGYLLGDEGSGMALGLTALRALAHDLDLHQETPLRTALADQLGLRDRASLLEYVYRNPKPIQHVAPILLNTAASGDAASVQLVRAQTEAIGSQIQRLATQYAQVLRPQLAFIGGLYDHSFYRNRLQDTLRNLLPEWRVIAAKHQPVWGAWKMATQLI